PRCARGGRGLLPRPYRVGDRRRLRSSGSGGVAERGHRGAWLAGVAGGIMALFWSDVTAGTTRARGRSASSSAGLDALNRRVALIQFRPSLSDQFMTSSTAEGYASVIAARIASERLTLAARWLERLREMLTVAANDVFPSDQLLDHIPSLVQEISSYLAAPAEQEIAANAAVMEKARELGALRHKQRATAHQLLHEYEILGEILETFLVDETQMLGLRPTVEEC